MKRGQVTAFVIVGIVLLMAVILLLYFILRTPQAGVEQRAEETVISPGADAIKFYIDDCMKQSGEKAVVHVSVRGGYYEVIGYHVSYKDINIPYYFYEGQKDMPVRDDIKNELEKAFKNYASECLIGLETFIEQGYMINEKGNVTITASILENNVFFDVNMPLEVIKNEETFNYNKFNANIKIPLNKMINLTEKFAVFQAENPDALKLSHLIDLSLENNIYTEIIRQEEGDVIF